MEFTFDVTIKNRKLFKSFLENFTLEELNKIPEGFNNNIFWNIAHTVVTQQLLVYKLSGLPTVLTEDFIDLYKKGTKPDHVASQSEVDFVKGLLFSTIDKTKEDFKNRVFQNYHEYTVTTKSTLTNVEEAIAFNNYHEGIHLGYILALKKAMGI